MDIQVIIPKGRYVVAVSGGVDSVVLLDVLAKDRGLNLIVAHFNHGIRQDSDKDENLSKQIAQKYGLVFESTKGNLGKDVSEAKAREARYHFLKAVKHKYNADAIITAHHQDDLIETSMINILRGTNRRGLTALKTRNHIIRPLLLYPKSALITYAKEHKLIWHEDSTNKDKKYLRNQVRIDVVAKMTSQQRVKWLKILDSNEKRNKQIDDLLEILLKRGLHKGRMIINRKWFATLPHSISKEIIAFLVHKVGVRDIDKKTIERLATQIKTLPAGKTIQATGFEVKLTKRSARLNFK
jgi:tRNA(Ile)-lysidine synthase